MEEYKDLKLHVTKKVIEARKGKHVQDIDFAKKLEPRFVSYDEVLRPDGAFIKRKKVILMSSGCCVPTCTMCPFTNYNYYGCKDKKKISIVSQVEDILMKVENEPEYEELALYNDGSFFAEAEVSTEDLRIIAGLIRESSIKILSVETLPQFITKAKLEMFTKLLGDNIQLEVGIGLQSVNPIVRELCVNTSFSNKEFENAVEVLNDVGAELKTYLLLKPPFLTDEEAVNDALDSLEYLETLGSHYVTLCPVRISPNTLIADLATQGLYAPINLKSVIDVLRDSPSSIKNRVACINLGKVDFESVTPSSCEKCNDQLVDALIAYASKDDINKFPKCTCGENFEPISRKKINNDELILRIKNYINK